MVIKTTNFSWCCSITPVAWGDQNSAYVCPCACRKRRLIMGYKLSYTTGLLYAWSFCMQWGVWVWTAGHWIVLVQVIYCPKDGWVISLKNQRHPWEEIMSYSHSRKPDLPATHSTLLSTWLSYSTIFSSTAKTTLSRQGYGFCWWRRKHCHRNCPTLIIACVLYCKHQIVYGFSLFHFLWLPEASVSGCGDKSWPAASCTSCLQNTVQ